MPRISKDYRYSPYFLTITVIDWIDIFTGPKYFELLADSLDYCIQKKGLILYEYVFMTNHIHFIASADENGYGLDSILRDFKRHTTKKMKELLDQDNRKYILSTINVSSSKKKGADFQVWQKENFAELMTSEEMVGSKINYIWNNPVRKGYVSAPDEWLYGSARQKMRDLPKDHEDVMIFCEDVPV